MKVVLVGALAVLVAISSGCFGPATTPRSHSPKGPASSDTLQLVTADAVQAKVSQLGIAPFREGDTLVNLRCSLAGALARCVGTPSYLGYIAQKVVWFRLRPDGSIAPICDRRDSRLYCRD